MDYPPEEGFGVALLGKLDPSHSGGTVHGGRRDLWRRHLSAVSST